MIKKSLKNMVCGMCMAAADSVPGVSGGSIAYLMGFYQRLVDAVEGITSWNKEKIRGHLPFLLTLGFGWIIGFGLCVSVLSAFFRQDIYGASSLFLGFTIAAAVFLMADPQVRQGWTLKRAGCLLLGIASVCAAAQLGVISRFTFQLLHLDAVTGILLFLIGALAISAMILPGISGSTILLIFGLYVPVIDAVKNTMHMDFRYLPALLIFLLGVWVGISGFIRLLKRLLAAHGTAMKFNVAGMVIGSIYAVILGPVTVSSYGGSMLSFSNCKPALFSAGVLLVALLEIVRSRSARQKIQRREKSLFQKKTGKLPLDMLDYTDARHK
ncbi:MAG: DUF368 domain-containing protein [Eubacterium sp.]